MAGISAFKCPCFRPPSSSLSYASNPFLLPHLRVSSPALPHFPKFMQLLATTSKWASTLKWMEILGRDFLWQFFSLFFLSKKLHLSVVILGFRHCLEFLHVKPGKGAAFVRTTLRNYVTGNQVEKTFRAGSKIEEADIFKETKQYTYKDGSQYVFMDLSTYEEFRLNEADVGDKSKWLKEGMDCNLLFWKRKVIDFELPITVKLKVVEADPGVKGDTAQGGSKPVTVDTGAVVSVPLFIGVGEEILIDTRTGQYMSRA
ncbi:UNVERIFIED_CONTAM: Elongation factor P [Sesamum radiatum]|uniref:Elongation factor P n=1 Tax=Sesamum radiatum TaxID=300843 RepID=A0AAW2KSM9_SESRA